MDTRLYKLARRSHSGTWHWTVPGFGNGVTYNPNPTGFGAMQWGPALSWPERDERGDYIRRVDLDRWRKPAKAAVRKLIDACKAAERQRRKDRKPRRKGYPA